VDLKQRQRRKSPEMQGFDEGDFFEKTSHESAKFHPSYILQNLMLSQLIKSKYANTYSRQMTGRYNVT